MTVRAIFLGLLAAVALAAVGYFNDIWLGFPSIGGNLMPTHAFGLLMVGLLAVNPLLRWLGRWKFTSGEFVVMLSLVLMGSLIAGSGLLWVFPHPVITPIHDQQTKPGWRDKDLLQYVPRVMIVEQVYRKYANDHDIRRKEGESWQTSIQRSVAEGNTPAEDLEQLQKRHRHVITSYMQGMGRPGRRLPFGRAPWASWLPALSFWFCVLGLNFIAGLAAVVVVHRQWSSREHLAFPIAAVASELIEPPADGGPFNAIFRNRGFWLGFALAFGVWLINGCSAWWPGFVSIPLGIDFRPLNEILGAVGRVPWVNLLNVRFYFAAVGLAYFLTSEASFSLGLSAWLYVLAAAPLVAAGVNMQTDVLAGGLPAFMYFGAYMGLAVMVLYLGRQFYWAVLRRSLWLGGGEDVLPREVAAFRILILANAALVGLLWWLGLHPLLSVAFVLLTGTLFLMVGRINVATGLFIIQPFWHPVTVLAAIFGSFALGPHALVILALLSVVVTIDPRIAAVPLALNAVRLGELQKIKPGRLARWMAIAVILAMVAGVVVTVWGLYDLGVQGMDSGGTRWAVEHVAQMPFRMLERAVDELSATDSLKAAAAPTSLGRLLAPKPKKFFFTAAGIGFALVMICSYFRLRFPRWPLHPMLFLVWGSRWTTEFAPSFLLAWFIKTQILRYGGQSYYRRARTFFIGLMGGEFTAGIFWGAIGAGHYFLKGILGPSISVRP